MKRKSFGSVSDSLLPLKKRSSFSKILTTKLTYQKVSTVQCPKEAKMAVAILQLTLYYERFLFFELSDFL